MTQKEKIQLYEHFLHDLNFASAVVMDSAWVHRLIGNACAWSYAHRQGNGEYSEREQQRMIDRAATRLSNRD